MRLANPGGLLLLACLAAFACERDPSDPPLRDGPEGETRGRFVVEVEGALRDTTSGLLWTRSDGALDLPWPAAHRYCQELGLAGRGSWRLPEIEELAGLYDEQAAQSCAAQPCRVDPAFALTGPWFWSATRADPARRFYLDFRFGTRLSPQIRPTLRRRVLCVHEGG